jgi:hypothetical protein
MNVRNFIFPLRNEQDAIASTVTPVTFDRLQISYGSMRPQPETAHAQTDDCRARLCRARGEPMATSHLGEEGIISRPYASRTLVRGRGFPVVAKHSVAALQRQGCGSTLGAYESAGTRTCFYKRNPGSHF